MKLSPDTLALNPDLAKQLKKSKAKTPSGKGYGHTDNAQAYTTPPPSHNTLCRQNARTCYNILSGHVGKLNDSALEEYLAAALDALARIGGENAILIERGRGDMKHKEEDKKFADLAMKITGERSLWTLRAWTLVNMLKECGVDANWVLKADMNTLADLFEEQAARLNQQNA